MSGQVLEVQLYARGHAKGIWRTNRSINAMKEIERNKSSSITKFFVSRYTTVNLGKVYNTVQVKLEDHTRIIQTEPNPHLNAHES